MRERKTARKVKDRLIGEFDIPGMPVKFSAWPDRTDVKADLLGENNETVLREYLGLSDAEIAQAIRRQGAGPRPDAGGRRQGRQN